MLCLVDSAVDLMRAKHKNGEEFYWLLYYAYLSPQEFQNVEEIIDQLRPHIRDISTRTYYRKRKEAVEVLSSVLWGYTAQDSAGIVREFCGQESSAPSRNNFPARRNQAFVSVLNSFNIYVTNCVQIILRDAKFFVEALCWNERCGIRLFHAFNC